MVDPNTRQGKRTPVTLKIKFKSETLEQFIERYAVDVSQGGIFIRTKEPLPVGTQMKFEFQLRDASPLIAGEGTVVWTRENDPSRPAIAPGMGVRFDRLADGSQGVLERILSEKAKQAPPRPADDTPQPPMFTETPMFTDTPTRVAPIPVQEALLGKGNSRTRRPSDDAHSDSHTPLPKPIPFHSDADEFPDEAFEEATKVRQLDELIAQTADGNAQEDTPPGRRGNGRSDTPAGAPAPDRFGHRPGDAVHVAAELADASDLPPPDRARSQSRPFDRGPSPSFPEPARARAAPATPPPSSLSPVLGGELPPLPPGMRAGAAEPTEPARLPPLRPRSIAPLLILIFVVVAAAGAAVWFLLLRPQQIEPRTASGQPDGPLDPAATPGAGSPRSPAAPPTGNAEAPAGSRTSGAGTAAPRAELVDTVIDASVAGARVEILGTNQSGPVPLTARLEKGRPYKARITARGFAALEIDVSGGDAKQTPKLVPKPHVLSIASDPPGAQISVNSAPIGHVTPFVIELTRAQVSKKYVRVVLRKPGFRAIDRTIELAKFTEDDTRVHFQLEETLTSAQATVPGRAGSPAGPAGGSARPTGRRPSGAGRTAASRTGVAQGNGSAQGTQSPGGEGPATGSAGSAGAGGSSAGAGAAPGAGSEGTSSSSSSGSAAEPEPEFTKE